MRSRCVSKPYFSVHYTYIRLAGMPEPGKKSQYPFECASHSYRKCRQRESEKRIKLKNGRDLRVHWLAMQNSNCNGRIHNSSFFRSFVSLVRFILILLRFEPVLF